MNRITWTLLFFHTTCFALWAQVNQLTYSGVLQDLYSESAIAGATVLLSNDSSQFESVSNRRGEFLFKNLPAGYYRLTFQSLGYQTKSIAEVEIHSGIPRRQVFNLTPAEETIEEVVVKAESRTRLNEAVASIYTLTVEESFRFPGTFYDPARLATHYAGVFNENDQANNLVVRGNSPNGLGWYLEGVEIVNPNHLSNAGTTGDRSSQSGGGVNILSAQMLDNSTFLTGAFPATYGNATTGIFDMRLREGARDQTHITAQIGLIGIDAAIEGPIGRSKDDTYLINYRYSALGLLASMGVDLGDESIRFQDLSFHLKWKLGQVGTLSFFGIGGLSSNVFEAPVFELREDFKDQQNINFDSRMAASGVKFENTRWEHVLAYSGYQHQRSSLLSRNVVQLAPFEDDASGEQRLGLHSRRKFQISHGAAQLGIRANLVDYQASSTRFLLHESHDNYKNGYILQAYGDVRRTMGKRIQLQGGMHLTHFSLNNSTVLEPRFGVTYQSSPKIEWAASYGLHSRIAPPGVLLIARRQGFDNSNLDFIRSHHIVLANNYHISPYSKLITEIYYQQLFNVPIVRGNRRSLSTINSLDYIFADNFVSEGVARNVGIELTYQQYFTSSTYFLLNGTLYDSKYTGGDGIERNTRYNGQFGFNVTGGKEFNWQKNNKVKMVGLNLRATWFGGFWESPVDIVQSVFHFRTVYDETRAFTWQLPNFFKIDLRVYYKRVKKKYTSILGLDILNATNHQNIAYHYFDLKNIQVTSKYHLGLIPNLSYRIEF